MFSIAGLIARAKSGAGIESDYRLAKIIGVSHSTLSHYGSGYTLPNERVIEQLCALSGDDPDLIAAQIQAVRAKDEPARLLWNRVAARLSGAILSVLFAIGLIAAPVDSARASAGRDTDISVLHFIYIVLSTAK